jgi:hypothetical protein
MGLDSYLELFTTIYGWKLANSVYEFLNGIGFVFLPFIVTIISVWREAHENGYENGGAEWSVRKLEVEIYSALFVIAVAFVPTPWTTLDRVSLLYKPDGTLVNPNPATATGANSGTTFDQAFKTAGMPNSVPVPLWWFAVMALSSGFNAAVRASVTDEYMGLRQVEEMARLATIEDPALRSEAQLFRDQCFVPAHAKFHDPDTPRSVWITSILLDPLYGRDDTEWVGSLSYQQDPDYYRSFRARQPIRGFALDMTGDDSDAPPGTTGNSMPNCLRWWTDPQAGLRDRLVNQSGSLLKRAEDGAWAVASAANTGFKIGPIAQGVFNADYIKDQMLRQALWRSHSNFVQTDQVIGGQNNSRWSLPEFASGIGIASKGFEASFSYYPVVQFLTLAQPFVLMALYFFTPLVLWLSRFSLSYMVYGAVAIFTVKFWAAMWAVARYMDERLVVTMYGDTTILVREYFTNGLDGGSKRAVLNALTVACFIVFPLLWSGMMSWIGFKVGAAVGDVIESAYKSGSSAGKSAMETTTDVAKKGAGKLK